MSETVDKRLVSEPHLLDVIDDAWLKETLPDDCEWRTDAHKYMRA